MTTDFTKGVFQFTGRKVCIGRKQIYAIIGNKKKLKQRRTVVCMVGILDKINNLCIAVASVLL